MLYINGYLCLSCSLHVRRTDKRSEAKYHALEEYMEHVSLFVSKESARRRVCRACLYEA